MEWQFCGKGCRVQKGKSVRTSEQNGKEEKVQGKLEDAFV